MTSRRRLVAAAIGIALSPVVFAQQKTVLKASDVHALGYPTVEAMVRMGRKLEAQTNGRLSIQMFPAMQLGSEKEMIEQAQIGALQIARVSVGSLGPVVDEVNVFNLPFVFRDEGHMRKVIDGPIGQELLDRAANDPKSALVPLGWMDAGTRNIYAKKAIKRPPDLRGQKIRMMGNPIFLETMNAMGGTGVSMGFTELYSAMQTGVVDGAENNAPTYLTQNHYQITRYYNLTGHLIIPEILVFSKRSWEKLSNEDHALIKKLAREAQIEQRQLWDAMVTESTAKLKAAGVQFVEVDRKAFYDAARPVRDKYGAKYAALIKRIEDTK
jgi:tripartite ATP-independent transporter DctP family solute receptor